MRFREISALRESYFKELIVTVQDLLLLHIQAETKEIATRDFMQELAQEGYNLSVPQLIQAVDQSGYATSVDREKIVPKSELPAELSAAGPESPEEKVDDLASREAKKSLK